MENRRFILIALLFVVLFFLYQAWQDDYAKPSPMPQLASNGNALAEDDVAAALPLSQDEDAISVGAVGEGDDSPQAVVPTSMAADHSTDSQLSQEYLEVETDVIRARISLQGGEIRSLELKRYPLSKDTPETPVPLLGESGGQYHVVQSGLAGTNGALASAKTLYQSAQSEYRLGTSQDALEVRLSHNGDDGLAVEKVYRFERGSYEIGLQQRLVNGSNEALTVSPYARLTRNETIVGQLPKFVVTFLGVGFFEKKDGSDGYRFAKTDLDDLDDDAFQHRQRGGWIAMLQHYFVAAILPPKDSEGVFSAQALKDGKRYRAQYVATGTRVEPGASQDFSLALYVGPKLQTGIEPAEGEGGFFSFLSNDGVGNISEGLEYTVDYGILTPLCEPLFWLLAKFHSFTGNWGIAIILLTLVVKAAFYKLSEAQYRSMGKMRKFAPRIQELKERYGDDREKMSKAMMELYKKEGFNPLAGCWPLLVQFPVFIALYWVLLESVELRQADFALWINDLSAPDPYFVLPLLFGLSFYIQQKWSGATATMDPMQQKIMNIMPIMMTAFFTFFQAGLVLYWLVSNLIGMAQQWFINKKLDKEGLGKPKPA